MSNKRTILSSSSLQQEDNVNSEGDICYLENICGAGQT